jgi:hypothetical protein
MYGGLETHPRVFKKTILSARLSAFGSSSFLSQKGVFCIQTKLESKNSFKFKGNPSFIFILIINKSRCGLLAF